MHKTLAAAFATAMVLGTAVYAQTAEDAVGVLLDRSVAQVTDSRGTVRAGAAYVPLDRAQLEAALRKLEESTR